MENNRAVPQNITSRFRDRRAWCYVIIVVVTAVAFSPIMQNGFTNFDDNQYVTGNQSIQGFSLNHIARQFSSNVGNFHPLTMMTLMADYSMYGLNPVGYHLTNLLFHMVNSLIVFALAAALTKSNFAALFAALLFAVHPLRVESVAWVSERKGVVSTFFYLLSLWVYLKFSATKQWRLYICCLAFFVLSLLAKQVAVSLPLVLLLIDYLNNRRITARAAVEKWPFFVIAALFAVTVYGTQSQYGALAVQANMPLLQRVALPFYGILFYLYKTVVPLHLCAYYPYNPAFSDHAVLYPVLAIAAGTPRTPDIPTAFAPNGPDWQGSSKTFTFKFGMSRVDGSL